MPAPEFRRQWQNHQCPVQFSPFTKYGIHILVFKFTSIHRFAAQLLCIVGIMLSSHASANFSTQNVEGVLITFLDDEQYTPPPTQGSTSASSQAILSKAMSLEGIKYRYGGASPEKGFDCSGLVNYVFKKAANIKLPRTTRGLQRISKTIPKQNLIPGDLVFFNTRKRAFSHVGIYLGKGDFIHAPRTGGKVRIENIKTGYWNRRFNGGKRVKELNGN